MSNPVDLKSAAPGMFDMEAAPMRIGHVQLRVRNLVLVAAFYRNVIGLTPIEERPNRVSLGIGGAVLLDLVADPHAVPGDRRAAGLFHTAFLLPDRADLGRWLKFAANEGIELQGAADHRVSEAVYLADPEGNGIEIYSDRPVEEWPVVGGRFDMGNERLDIPGLIDAGSGAEWAGMPVGSRIGHMHLQVGDLSVAEPFYGDVLGFDVTCRYRGATFLGAGGYHHQVAANIWNSSGAGPRSAAMSGLAGIEIVVLDATVRAAIEDRARQAGYPLERSAGGTVLRDPWGIALTLVDG